MMLRMISSVVSELPANAFISSAQGIKRSLAEAGGAAQKIAEGDLSPNNFTSLIQAGIEIKANRAVAITADDMVGTLLDRKA
jgi:hypothetical protein